MIDLTELVEEMRRTLEFYAAEGHYDLNGPGSVWEDGYGMPHRVAAAWQDRGDRARAVLEKLKTALRETPVPRLVCYAHRLYPNGPVNLLTYGDGSVRTYQEGKEDGRILLGGRPPLLTTEAEFSQFVAGTAHTGKDGAGDCLVLVDVARKQFPHLRFPQG